MAEAHNLHFFVFPLFYLFHWEIAQSVANGSLQYNYSVCNDEQYDTRRIALRISGFFVSLLSLTVSVVSSTVGGEWLCALQLYCV